MGPWPWLLIVIFDARSVGPNRVIAIVIAMGKGLEGVDRIAMMGPTGVLGQGLRPPVAGTLVEMLSKYVKQVVYLLYTSNDRIDM